jgi:hypothetical protein
MKDFMEEDPFLCPECAKAGYCIKRQDNQAASTEELTNEDENTPTSYESIDPVIEVMEEELVEED